jgi:lysophospholipase L1-like esterase
VTRRTLRNRFLLALVGAPALVSALLVLIELAFIVAGRDPRQHYFLPSVDEQGRALFVESGDTPIANTHFRVDRLLARPPPGTKRVLCIGDSTCFGHPFDPPVPFANLLDARLKCLLPGTPVEVVNLASSGFDSEAMLDVLTDVDAAGADVVLIYSGHNEFLDRNLAPVVHPLAHALKRALARTRAGSWLLRKIRRPDEPWTASLNDQKQPVRSQPLFTDREIARGQAHYGEMLDAMVALARRRGATVLVLHPVSDVVDTPVEASVFSPGTPPEARSRFLDGLARVRQMRRRAERASLEEGPVEPSKVGEALREVDELAAIDASVASLHYERGRLLLLDGPQDERRQAEALKELVAARDADGSPIRATTAILAIQEEVARRGGARVVDPNPALLAAAAPGLPGRNGWFVDYCHPDVKGHQLIADVLIHALADANLLAPRSQWRFGDEPTPEEYLKRGGYDAAAQAETWAKRALFLLTTSHFGESDGKAVDAAWNLCQSALKLDESCVSAWIGLGVVATIRRQRDEALADFDRAAASKPGALDPIGEPYRTNPLVKRLFDAAGLVFRDGRVVRAH